MADNDWGPHVEPADANQQEKSGNPVDSVQGGTTNNNLPDAVDAADGVGGSDTPRTFPRQVLTGTQRGTQSLTGEQIVKDPSTSNTVITTSGPNQNTTYTDPNTNQGQVQIGRLANGSYGMKVAQPEFDVSTATDNQLIFNSNQNIFKIVDKITSVSIPQFDTTAGYGYVKYPHGQSKAPIINAYAAGALFTPDVAIIAVSYIPLPLYVSGATTTLQYFFALTDIPGNFVSGVTILYGVDSTYIHFLATCDVAAHTISAIPLTIFILQETANPVV